MRFGPAIRHHATALLAGFIGGAAGWLFLDSTVSAQSDVIEASKVVVGDNIVIENGQIAIRSPRRSDSFATLNMQGLTIQNGQGKNAQSASVSAGKVSVVTEYDERPAIWKRVDLEAGAINYYPDWKTTTTSPEVEELDMDVLFKRQRAELNARRNRTGRI
jgi:hypothetical protein